MCGISGLITKSKINRSQLASLSSSLRHRGPDDEGYLLFNSVSGSTMQCSGTETMPDLHNLQNINGLNEFDANIAFVHRRLSIIDLTVSGHQPMCDKSGRYWIVFNGEVYNYPELKDELKSGYSFRSTSDTEVILAAYSAWGEHCVERFVGMWAFAILDTIGNTVFISRDRFGIKPLYYVSNDSGIAFASEIKALLNAGLTKPEANMANMARYIAFGNTLDQPLFKDVISLEPGHNMKINLNDLSLKVESFYSPGAKQFIKYDKPEMEVRNYKDLLIDSVKMHLRSDEPVGSCLSGGIDSSILVSIAAGFLDPNPFKTFTAAYPGNRIDESKFATMVGSSHSNIIQVFCYPDSEKLFGEIDKIVYQNDFPVNSTSVYAQWEVMKTVSENNIKVLLDGQGADETLGGYYPFAGIYLVEELIDFRIFRFFRDYYDTRQNFTNNINIHMGRSLYYFLPSRIQKYIRQKKRLGPGLLSKDFRYLLESMDVPDIGGRSFNEHSIKSIRWGLTELLRYEDRNSMAFSIESRVPFLDHRLVDYALSLEKEYKLHYGWTKYILRKAAKPYLPEEIIYRKDKIGFATPQKEWKSEKTQNLRDYIHETNIPEILDAVRLMEICNSDLKNPTQNSEFWRIVTLLKWFEIFKVRLS